MLGGMGGYLAPSSARGRGEPRRKCHFRTRTHPPYDRGLILWIRRRDGEHDTLVQDSVGTHVTILSRKTFPPPKSSVKWRPEGGFRWTKRFVALGTYSNKTKLCAKKEYFFRFCSMLSPSHPFILLHKRFISQFSHISASSRIWHLFVVFVLNLFHPECDLSWVLFRIFSAWFHLLQRSSGSPVLPGGWPELRGPGQAPVPGEEGQRLERPQPGDRSAGRGHGHGEVFRSHWGAD